MKLIPEVCECCWRVQEAKGDAYAPRYLGEKAQAERDIKHGVCWLYDLVFGQKWCSPQEHCPFKTEHAVGQEKPA